MRRLFTLGEQVHHGGDRECPACVEGYPERCRCGGLIHAADVAIAENLGIVPLTQCDRCQRSKEELDEVA
jgi:hypothetical protein